jgi:hypothetical protein
VIPGVLTLAELATADAEFEVAGRPACSISLKHSCGPTVVLLGVGALAYDWLEPVAHGPPLQVARLDPGAQAISMRGR